MHAIDSLRCAGDYATARSRAAALAASARSADLPAWQRGDLIRLERTLEFISQLPDSARAALAAADRSSADVQALVVADQSQKATKLAAWQLEVRRRHLGDEHPDVASSLDLLAERWSHQGDWVQARELAEQSLAMRRRMLGADHPAVATSLRSLGAIMRRSNSYDPDAEGLLLEALAIERRTLPAGDPEVATTINALANVYRGRGQLDRAIPLFEEVIALRRKHLGADHDDVAAASAALAMTYLAADRPQDAERCAREAVAIRRRIAGVPGERLAFALNVLGSALRVQGRFAAAETLLVEAADRRETLWRNTLPGVRARGVRLGVYWDLAACRLQQGKTTEAWCSMQRGLSRDLVEALERLEPDLARRDSSAAGALVRLQATLPAGTVLVGWLEGRRGGGSIWEYPYWCYAIRSEGPIHWVRRDAPAGGSQRSALTDVGRAISRMRHAAAWPFRGEVSSELLELATTVYAQRLAPLEPWIRDADGLLVASPTFHHGFPVEAMVDSSGTFLLERFAVAYVPSATWYVRRRSFGRTRSDPSEWKSLLVGVPSAVRWKETPLPPLARVDEEIRSIAALWWKPKILFDARATPDALRDLRRNAALEQFDLVHIAAHAVCDYRLPEQAALVLKPSPTPLAPAAIGDAATASELDPPGLVTAREIRDCWRLQSSLVCLSGCETAMGRSLDTEGIEGLQSAMLCAGARCLLVSLWKVDDEATSLLLQRFYSNLTGKDSSGKRVAVPQPMTVSLQEAKVWLSNRRDSAGNRPFAHPAYWAGFVLIGDPGEFEREPRAAD